jgi:hypothetical protein
MNQNNFPFYKNIVNNYTTNDNFKIYRFGDTCWFDTIIISKLSKLEDFNEFHIFSRLFNWIISFELLLSLSKVECDEYHWFILICPDILFKDICYNAFSIVAIQYDELFLRITSNKKIDIKLAVVYESLCQSSRDILTKLEHLILINKFTTLIIHKNKTRIYQSGNSSGFFLESFIPIKMHQYIHISVNGYELFHINGYQLNHHGKIIKQKNIKNNNYFKIKKILENITCSDIANYMYEYIDTYYLYWIPFAKSGKNNNIWNSTKINSMINFKSNNQYDFFVCDNMNNNFEFNGKIYLLHHPYMHIVNGHITEINKD